MAELALQRWIADVCTEHAKALRALRVEVVHDLRVAIRRCRSVAQGLKEIDRPEAAQGWRALNEAGRALFSGLGALRDAQVMREHTSELAKDDPSLRTALAAIDRRVARERQVARAAVRAFDARAWTRIAQPLPARCAT